MNIQTSNEGRSPQEARENSEAKSDVERLSSDQLIEKIQDTADRVITEFEQQGNEEGAALANLASGEIPPDFQQANRELSTQARTAGEQLDDQLDALQQEKREQELQIDYDFFFASYATPGDFERLQARFDECDIYVPEAVGWTPENLNYIRRISTGEEDTMALDRDSAVNAKEMEEIILYKSNKPIEFIDSNAEQEAVLHEIEKNLKLR